jgi:superfamily II DNA or RNA helicase
LAEPAVAQASSVTSSGDLPSPGEIARVRQRLYLVEETVQPPKAGDSSLVKLSCVDDDAQGQRLEVLWERELDAEVLTGEAWEAITRRGFDPPPLFSAYLNTLRWNCVTATDPRLFQSPFRAGIHLDAYQLEPLQKALLLPRVNLFIADDVGLGKTIEAALIARELLLRKKAREILVSCPPSMLLQWQDELETRFGLVFQILDKDYVQRVRRERGFGVNPWSTHSRFLISHRLLIDEAYAGPLRDWLGEFRSGTLLILDEAHHAAPSSGQKYAIDSRITRAVRDLAPRFEHRLFLSATPHNGHSNSFSALLEIMDPQRFCRGVPADKDLLNAVMVRRLKDDLRETRIGRFPLRRVVQVDIDGLAADAPELQLAALLDEYRRLREERLSGETRRKQAAAGLLITGLQQRLLSSIEAFARTLKVHRKTVQRYWEESQTAAARSAPPDLQLDLLTGSPGNDDDRATLPVADLQAEEDAQVTAATVATAPSDRDQAGKLFAREQQLLDRMTQAADAARAEPDARVRKLIDWIRKNMCPNLGKPGARWNDLRIIIFTEYDDTKRYLQQQLAGALDGSDRAEERIAVYHGPTPPDEREAIKEAFNADPRRHPVRILIATDAAREGLNLQAHCWNLFHFDVPWNPSRMEQRNGRIDRKLQSHAEVFCHYFVYRQRPEDRILKVLVEKTERIKKELGSLAQVIDARLADTLRSGIRRDRIETLEKEILAADLEGEQRKTVDEELESSRRRQDDLRRQVDTLRDLVEKSKESIGLDDEQFRQAISCALELLGAEPLKAGEDKAGEGTIPMFQFPALDQREAADPTWADTLDTLRAPRDRSQKLWEWRRSSPIRAVVFEDTGKLDDDVVHLHLEHRVVQRLLSRFIAQGFVHHDLSRACLAQTTDAIPRAILLGRLCLYGPGAARLHEEIVPVTARWTDPRIRKNPLTPYAREAETKTLQLLRDSLTRQAYRRIDRNVQDQLLAATVGDLKELLPHLQARGEEYARDARQKLHARGQQEAGAMQKILETQKKHISTTQARQARDEQQSLLPFFGNEDELRQLEANKRYWAKRLTMIDRELQTEPQRIAGLYQVQATRIEPVGLVYLWPVTG